MPDVATTVDVAPIATAQADWARMVLINAIPVFTGLGAVEFADWLRPYIEEVEEDNGGVFWNSLDYAKGPGQIANVVARDFTKRGLGALPPVLTVDKFHPAWQAVRDILGTFEGILYIQATR